MEFNIGSVFINVSSDERVVIVAPIGGYMIALSAELFRLDPKPSVSVLCEVYAKGDIVSESKVERWIEGRD